MTKHVAVTLGPRGITVNTLAPGAFPTDLLKPFSDGLAEGAETIAKTMPMRRIGQPQDIVAACLWLSGRGGSWITG